MRYEMKDILKTMIDNNVPHWSADTMDMVRVELEHLYAQAAKADEYEAKAKAFDEISDYWRTKDELKLGHFVDKAIRKYAGECESGGLEDESE